MKRFLQNLFGSSDQDHPNQQNPVAVPSDDSIDSPEQQDDELSLLLKEKDDILNRLIELRDYITELEKRKVAIDIQIQRISLVNMSMQTDENEDNQDYSIDTSKVVIGVKPKPLRISGYDSVKDVLCEHINSLIGYSSISYPYTWYNDKVKAIAVGLSLVGKELIFIKGDKHQKKWEEWQSIIDTCHKILSYKERGDEQGYQKYLDFFLQKYPLPIFHEETFSSPDLFLKNESIYEDAFLLISYICHFKTQIRKEYQKEKDAFWTNFPDHVIIQKCEIDNLFINYMEMLYMLRKKGFTLAIIPILDENILYRPKRVAQNDQIYSLYYYDSYLEDPQMVGIEQNQSLSESSYYSISGNTTYVSGHYRSGYWRNGRYVRGGYVKGHYRR